MVVELFISQKFGITTLEKHKLELRTLKYGYIDIEWLTNLKHDNKRKTESNRLSEHTKHSCKFSNTIFQKCTQK